MSKNENNVAPVPIESMTGFAMTEDRESGFFLSVTTRSVNSRGIDVRVRLPGPVQHLEPVIRDLARTILRRGKVDFEMQLLAGSAQTSTIALDLERARAVRASLGEIIEKLGVEGSINLDTIVRAGGPQLFSVREDPSQKSLLSEAAEKLAKSALDRLQRSRLQEGASLRQDLLSGAGDLSRLVDETESLCVDLPTEYREKLLRKLTSIQERLVDEAQMRRVEQEIALYAEKVDIHEEIVRLRTHLEGFSQSLLYQEGLRGKRLDFLLQEMGREVNTLGSKIPKADVRGLVVDMKVLVETLRQQVSNVA